jgi:predicted phage terminase large subunit-like protein
MTAPLPREKLERFGRLLAEYRRRQSKDEQSQRGWYDADGVRQGGLIAFVRYYWKVLEPETPFVDGWPLWAVCEHLEAVTFGEITRLLINVPPGFAKSMMVDVFWPAWEWGPMGRTHYRYVAFSYSASLTERDNDRFRMLIVHPSYQRLYGPLKTKVQQGDSTELQAGVGLRNKTTLKVMNTHTGWKLASSVNGIGTGERGDRIIIDDPHNVKESESDIVRNETVRWFRESISSRFNNLDSGALIIIMQRVHEDDVSGVILSLGFDYCHLMIPWEYDSARQFDFANERPVATTIGWTDPRCDDGDPEASDGDPAWPERYSTHAMARTQQEVGPYAWAGQYQQAPSPRGGGIFQRSWWQPWQPADGKYPLFEYIVASLDGAFTEKEENDPSALTVWGVFLHPTTKQRGIMLIDAWRKHLQMHGAPTPRNEHETINIGDTPQIKARKDLTWKNRVGDNWGLVEWVAWTCRFRRVDKLLIEAKATGITVAQEIQRLHGFEDWSVQLCTPKADKVARGLAVQPTFSQQKVWAPLRDWAEMVIDEMAVFPKGKYDDLTDSATQAIKHLRDSGLAQTDQEVSEAEAAPVRHRSRSKALYPV